MLCQPKKSEKLPQEKKCQTNEINKDVPQHITPDTYVTKSAGPCDWEVAS